MEIFYSSANDISATELSIKGDEFHHLVRVLRKKPGDHIRVVNGRGTAYDCIIESINSDVVMCSISALLPNYNEPKVEATLMVPILKNHSRMEWIIEKGTELGVRYFLPLYTSHTIRQQIRYQRFQKIAVAAMKQSTRSHLPSIQEAIPLEEGLRSAPTRYDKIFVGHEAAPQSSSIRNVADIAPGQRVLMLAGPEGGFTEEEIELCRGVGAVIVSLGARRFRAETAAILMAAHLIYD